MNRRNLLKSGLAIAGGSLLASNAVASTIISERAAPIAGPGKRKLGGKLEVSSIGLGVQNMSRTYQTTIPSRPQRIDIIRKAYDNGVTLFDTAEAYGPFECEKILGEAVASFRNKIVIETKFGWDIDPETGRMRGGLNSKPEHIKTAIEGMLKRLRTDRIDLVYRHRVDPNVPIEDVVGTLKDLIQQGKILHYGLSAAICTRVIRRRSGR
jgi:aryl-alcohol dehydrogenase-like predicted oxidoreductase